LLWSGPDISYLSGPDQRVSFNSIDWALAYKTDRARIESYRRTRENTDRREKLVYENEDLLEENQTMNNGFDLFCKSSRDEWNNSPLEGTDLKNLQKSAWVSLGMEARAYYVGKAQTLASNPGALTSVGD
jgi:hypothetical protein